MFRIFLFLANQIKGRKGIHPFLNFDLMNNNRRLPLDILTLLFSYFHWKDSLSASLSCHNWNESYHHHGRYNSIHSCILWSDTIKDLLHKLILCPSIYQSTPPSLIWINVSSNEQTFQKMKTFWNKLHNICLNYLPKHCRVVAQSTRNIDVLEKVHYDKSKYGITLTSYYLPHGKIHILSRIEEEWSISSQLSFTPNAFFILSKSTSCSENVVHNLQTWYNNVPVIGGIVEEYDI